MKMPTAVVRHRVPYKPGDQVSYLPADGSFSPDDRFPAVSATNGHSSSVPHPPPCSRDEVVVVPKTMAIESSASLSADPEGQAKRFPNLGPTRQDTELYFRRRRSARHKIKTQSRPMVTRSADRVVPLDSSRARLTYTTFSALSNSSDPANNNGATATPTSLKGFRQVHIDPYGVGNHVETSRSALPAFDSEAHPLTSSLPVFEQSRSCSSQAYVKPFSSFHRTGSSPAVVRAVVQQIDRSLTFHDGLGMESLGIMVRSSGGKKSEIPIKFLSESGQIRTSDLTHRVTKTSEQTSKPSQSQKTLQPSKYGFHRRSKSPTFKRLVEVAEKLQTVVLPDPDCDTPRSEGCQEPMTSPAHIRLPAVGVADYLEDGAGGDEGDGSDEEGEQSHPQKFPSSLPHRQPQRSASNNIRLRHNAATNTPLNSYQIKRSSSSSHMAARKSRLVSRNSSASPHKHDDSGEHSGEHDMTNGWGAWEAADGGSLENGMDPLRLMMPTALAPNDSHTELHLFLPRLADTPSEESCSGVASKTSPDRSRTRLASQSHLPASGGGGGGLQRGKSSPQIHPHTSLRPPQHPQGVMASGERSGRPLTKRFSSPVRVVRRDRTPKRRTASSVEMSESYEPFIRGEHLKEKLEDFPTLISLDLGSQGRF